MQEPRPFSAEFDRLYVQYLSAGAPASWEQWLEPHDEGYEDAVWAAAECDDPEHLKESQR